MLISPFFGAILAGIIIGIGLFITGIQMIFTGIQRRMRAQIASRKDEGIGPVGHYN
jgi:uncharacterized protein (DUF2062 family)